MPRDRNLSIDTTAASQGQKVTNSDEDNNQSPPIIEDEINFNRLHALRTFTETVEGRAKVEKGDTLILLDDSNSYWWLVKILKNDEVGYMPAEDIEMPFERLARLNKRKNVKLNIEESEIPVKQKNAKKKSVYFTSPECFIFEEEKYEDEDVQNIEENKELQTNQDDDLEVQLVEEPEEMDVQETNIVTPANNHQIKSVETSIASISAQTYEKDQQNIEVDVLKVVNSPTNKTGQQNDYDEPVIKQQINSFNDAIYSINSPGFAQKTSDVLNQHLETDEMTLISTLGSDFMDFSDDDEPKSKPIKFFGSGSGKNSPTLDESNKNTIVEVYNEKNNKGRKEKEKKDGIFKNFFKRKKKKDEILSISKPLKISYDQFQKESSKQQMSSKRSLRHKKSSTQKQTDSMYSVLRIFPGQNIQTKIKYKIGLVSQKTTAVALIKQAIHRFKLKSSIH